MAVESESGVAVASAMAPEPPVRLFYHDGLPGRAEFVRMVLEDGGVPYVDPVRDGALDANEMLERCAAFYPPLGSPAGARPFAPPYIELPDGRLIWQTANLMLYAAGKGGLAPEDEVGRLQLLSLLMTISDFAAEAHDTHHPLSNELYYEDQKAAARVKAGWFTTKRMGQALGFFDETLRANGGPWLMGSACTAADIGVLQLALGLEFAFPKAYAKASSGLLPLLGLLERVRARPHLAAYLASGRRRHFNRHCVFRNYPELDLVSEE